MDGSGGAGELVVISDYDYGDVSIEREILEKAGLRLRALQAHSEDELIAGAVGCSAIINQYATVGAKTLQALPTCRLVARYGTGVDIVDVEEATRRGVLVTHVREYCTDEVADHAMAMMLTLARRLVQYDRATHAGAWHWQAARPLYRLHGSVLGIVSFGRIGRAIAQRALAFGLKVIAHDPYVERSVFEAHGVVAASKDELVEHSDAIIVQAPLTPQTRHFLGEPEFRRMKPRVVVVNTGRGPTIDNAALYAALRDGRIAGAALDDTEEEPAHHAAWSPAENPLFTLPNVLITPHVAYYSEESIRLTRQLAAEEVARVLTGSPPRWPVNNVRLPDGSWSQPDLPHPA